MLSRTQILDPRLRRRRCLACGYDGALLRNGLAPRCARCGCDLHKRPARSYVEMEGLGGDPLPYRRLPGTEPEPPTRWLQRWVVFMFLVVFALMMVIYLSAAALTL